MDAQNPLEAVPAPTCVLVWTVGRSGSSAVAGMLAAMGVDFGPPFVGGAFRPANPTGTFEDVRLADLVDLSTVTIGAPGSALEGHANATKRDAWRRWVANRVEAARAGGALAWGAKYPGLSANHADVFPALDHAGVTDVRIVVVRRPVEAAARSYSDAFGRSHLWATQIVTRRTLDLDAGLRANARRALAAWPVLDVQFGAVVSDPIAAAADLARFALPVRVDPDTIRAAARTIRPSLVHHGV